MYKHEYLMTTLNSKVLSLFSVSEKVGHPVPFLYYEQCEVDDDVLSGLENKSCLTDYLSLNDKSEGSWLSEQSASFETAADGKENLITRSDVRYSSSLLNYFNFFLK
jgi:hypothetical protein